MNEYQDSFVITRAILRVAASWLALFAVFQLYLFALGTDLVTAFEQWSFSKLLLHGMLIGAILGIGGGILPRLWRRFRSRT
ncbi:hypothetical protein [Aquamicrobium sp. LC103]|uniref:hypothetical protein n=1 Tax=Aquamicrobium sp. LC103 TaxID=1120658 RepID=UPI00063EB58D|nr:hypothetical protein [Aquamicrobium sp. LC103]TKT80352.1 hypothetical protein XW59_008415 [Aquamicrobium sp. LC103]